jgi:hypothetical protein
MIHGLVQSGTYSMADVGHIDELERREYLVDHFHVTFESGSAWHCPCSEFTQFRVCRHTREAAGMRSAQASITRHLGRGGLPRTANHED